MSRLMPQAMPDDAKHDAELDRIVEAEMKKQNSHQCTKKEAEHIKAIIWKYFSREFAEMVLIAYGKKPGDSAKAYDKFQSMEKEWKNRKRASKEFFDYVKKNRIYGEDLMLTEEEKAILYDSGFIHKSN